MKSTIPIGYTWVWADGLGCFSVAGILQLQPVLLRLHQAIPLKLHLKHLTKHNRTSKVWVKAG
ncbi:hypothetical protein [Candidatus Bathycorpusculum sp.]|uniref:hypothetical protein n=1 Tax=Candidatus Bathycorpusculum sp. TaxID=2994959 RepID=UPI002822CB7F|nr:hypothetical protein [Candidatus Termitimicrobium sp.]MCL2431294.1 hypothetical protein [Candidatus Termitimicrobium sp.]MDR0471297.1 hypothetical protein [Nitrososphaerota archaeon]